MPYRKPLRISLKNKTHGQKKSWSKTQAGWLETVPPTIRGVKTELKKTTTTRSGPAYGPRVVAIYGAHQNRGRATTAVRCNPAVRTSPAGPCRPSLVSVGICLLERQQKEGRGREVGGKEGGLGGCEGRGGVRARLKFAADIDVCVICVLLRATASF